MPQRLITVTGPDRPGLIAAISRILADSGADLEDVSMTRLMGNFAMILVCRGGEEKPLRECLRQVAHDTGLRVHVEQAVERPVEQQPNAFVSAIGPNRVGIVAAISQTLAQHEANIVEMTTQLLQKTTPPVYVIRLEAFVPGDWDSLRYALENVAQTIGVEVRMEQLQQVDL